MATVILVAAGSATDPAAAPGTANVLGETLAETARRRLGPGLEVRVQVEREWTAFTLLAPPSLWRGGLDALAATLFRDAVAPEALRTVRDGLLARFQFEDGAPVREFQREFYGVLSTTASPWARPPRGRADAVRGLTPAALTAYRRSHYDAPSARVAVVGPVDAAAARAAVAAVGLASRPGTPRAPAGRPWQEGNRVMLAREVTNTWLGLAFPAPPDAPRTALEAVAHRVTEELNPGTPAPGIFVAGARVEDTPSGTVLLVEAAVDPEAAQRWETRILAIVAGLERPVEPAFFRWQRRRFRTARLLAESAPEDEGLRALLDLARYGRVRDLPNEIWALSPKDVSDSADDLGAPRILVLGPDLADSGR